jgi:ABC-type polysaccharide/polyol phosphate export permease
VTGYLSEIWRLRYFWTALVRNDLRSRYRRSIIGIGWSLLHPIAMTVVLCVVLCPLFHQPVREYAPFLLSGLTLWGFVMAVVTQGCHCFFQGESYIRQHPAPLAIYPLRTTLGAGFHFLLGLAIAIVFVWIVNGMGNVPALLSLIPTLLLLFLVGWSLAVCMGVADVVMQILFYVTPILYKTDRLADRPRLAWFVNLNPFAVLLELVRQPLLYGELPSLRAASLGALTGVLAVTAAALALKHFEKRMIFYL